MRKLILKVVQPGRLQIAMEEQVIFSEEMEWMRHGIFQDTEANSVDNNVTSNRDL
jgi:hypothetical protein